MTSNQLREIIYEALEVEGEKQECIVEVSTEGKKIFIEDEKGKKWKISITRIKE